MTFLIIFLFVMGTIWGSFLNVVILRSAKGKSFVTGRSMCPKCKHQLAWKDNIPLLSFLFLGGKCAYCKKKISLIYPVVEFLTGLFFVWWFWIGFGFFHLVGSPWKLVQPLYWLIVGLIFMVIFIIDLLYMIIPFWLNMLLLSVVMFYKVVLYGFGLLRGIDLTVSLLIGVGLAFAIYLISKLTLLWKGKEGFGLGDVFLIPSLGLILGWPKIVPGMFLAFVSGSVVGIVLLAFGKKKKLDYLPFGPFLILGTFLGLLYGDALWGYYISLLV